MPVNLKAVVRKLLEEHKTAASATAALADQISKDAELRRAAAAAIIRQHSEAKLKGKREVHSRRRPGPHRKPTPTRAQKLGALKAEKTYVETVFDRKMRGGRKLGEIRVHELRAIAEASASTATSFLQRGYEDAVETFACVALSNYCVTSDPFAKVRDVIKPSVATTIFEKAKISAAESLRDGSGRLAKELLAAAQKQELGTSL
jgi:hypothetical protein